MNCEVGPVWAQVLIRRWAESPISIGLNAEARAVIGVLPKNHWQLFR